MSASIWMGIGGTRQTVLTGLLALRRLMAEGVLVGAVAVGVGW